MCSSVRQLAFGVIDTATSEPHEIRLKSSLEWGCTSVVRQLTLLSPCFYFH